MIKWAILNEVNRVLGLEDYVTGEDYDVDCDDDIILKVYTDDIITIESIILGAGFTAYVVGNRILVGEDRRFTDD